MDTEFPKRQVIRQNAIQSGFSEHLVKAIEQSMAAAFERSTALCISEMNRVFDHYTRRSETRRLANGGVSLIGASVIRESGSAVGNYEMEKGGEIVDVVSEIRVSLEKDGTENPRECPSSVDGGNGGVSLDCSCCGVRLDDGRYSSYALLKTSSCDALERAQKENLITFGDDDDHRVEDGGDRIEFSSSAAESCALPRHINVWSEATSSESVEMLLKEVGQEEMVPGENMIEESDPAQLGSSTVVENSLRDVHRVDDVDNGIPSLPPDEVGRSSFSMKQTSGSESDHTLQVQEANFSYGVGIDNKDSAVTKTTENLSFGVKRADNNQGETYALVDESLSHQMQEDLSVPGNEIDHTESSSKNIDVSSRESVDQDKISSIDFSSSCTVECTSNPVEQQDRGRNETDSRLSGVSVETDELDKPCSQETTSSTQSPKEEQAVDTCIAAKAQASTVHGTEASVSKDNVCSEVVFFVEPADCGQRCGVNSVTYTTLVHGLCEAGVRDLERNLAALARAAAVRVAEHDHGVPLGKDVQQLTVPLGKDVQQLASPSLGMNLDDVELDMLGSCKKVTISKDDTVVRDGAGEKKSIEERSEQIRSAIELSTSYYDKEKLQERLAKLFGGVAVLKIRGASETKVGEKKYRVTDALNATKATLLASSNIRVLRTRLSKRGVLS